MQTFTMHTTTICGTTGLSFDKYISQEKATFAAYSAGTFRLKVNLHSRRPSSTLRRLPQNSQFSTWEILEGEDVDERMDRVWTWHALEELDHRSTVFDLYLAKRRRIFSGDVFIALIATIFFMYEQHKGVISFMRTQRGALFNLRAWRTGLPYLFGKRGAYRHLFFDWLKLFKPWISSDGYTHT